MLPAVVIFIENQGKQSVSQKKINFVLAPSMKVCWHNILVILMTINFDTQTLSILMSLQIIGTRNTGYFGNRRVHDIQPTSSDDELGQK